MDEDFYIALLYKEQEQSLSDEESMLLAQWLKHEPAHQQIAETIRSTWPLMDDYAKPDPIDINKEYEVLQGKIHVAQNTRTPTPSKVRKIQIWWVAASIIVIIGIGLLWILQPSTGTDLKWLVARAEVENLPLQLKDQSLVMVATGSMVEYPADFESDVRKVRLSGKAFFKVEKDNRPFVIETSQGSVEVLGTAFTVDENGKQIAVSVQEGKVRISHPSGVDSDVETGEKAIWSDDLKRFQIDQINAANVDSWSSHRLMFSQTPLAQVLADIEQYFGRSITIEQSSLMACPITMDLMDPSWNLVVDNLTVILGASAIVVGEGLILGGGHCPN